MAFVSHQSPLDNIDCTEVVQMLRACTRNVDPDITIAIAGEEPLKVHRQVLMQKSSYFADNIGKGMPDAVEILEFADISPNILKLVIEWMYSDNIVLTRSDTIDIYGAAKFFGIFELQVMCQQFISADVDCALEFLTRSFEENSQFTREEGVRLASFLFLDVVAHKDFPELKLDHLVALLDSDELNVTMENEVFAAALRWLLSDWESRRESCSDVMSHIRFNLLKDQQLEEILAKCEQLFIDGETPDFKIVAQNISSMLQENQKSRKLAKGPRKRGTYYKERQRSYEVDYTVSPSMPDTVIQSHGLRSGEITATVNKHNLPSFIDTSGNGNSRVSGCETVHHMWLRRLEVPPEMAHLVKMEAFVGLAHSIIDDEVSKIQPKADELTIAMCHRMPLREQESGESAQTVDLIADSTVMVDVVLDAEIDEDGSFEIPGFTKLPRFTKVAPTAANVETKSHGNQKKMVKVNEEEIEVRDWVMEEEDNSTLRKNVEVKQQVETTMAPNMDVTCNLMGTQDEAKVACPSYDSFDLCTGQTVTKTLTNDFSDETFYDVSSMSIQDFDDFDASVVSVDIETPRNDQSIVASELSEFSNSMLTQELSSTPRLLNSPEGDHYKDSDSILNVSSVFFGDDRQVLTDISVSSEGDVVTTTTTNMAAVANCAQVFNHQATATGKQEVVSRKIDTSRCTDSSFLLLFFDIKCPNLIESDDRLMSLEIRINPSLFEKKTNETKEESEDMRISVTSEGSRKTIIHIGGNPKDEAKVNAQCPLPPQSNLVSGEAFWKGSAASVPMAAKPKKDKVTEWLNKNAVEDSVEDDFKVVKPDKDIEKSVSDVDTNEEKIINRENTRGTWNRESTGKKQSRIPRLVGTTRSHVDRKDLRKVSGPRVHSKRNEESKASVLTVPMDEKKGCKSSACCEQAKVPRHLKCMQTPHKLNSISNPRQRLFAKPKANEDKRWKY